MGGYRYATGKRVIGSLLLGLYGDDGLLHHVGFISGFKASERRALTEKFERLRKPPGFTGNAPGGPSRWSTERTGEWEPVDPKIVVEVALRSFYRRPLSTRHKISCAGDPTKIRANARWTRWRIGEGKAIALL